MVLYRFKNMVNEWCYITIVYCEKAKLVLTQVPDAASHDYPDQCAHYTPIWLKSLVKHGI